MTTPRRLADIRPGEVLPELHFDATLTALVAYGAATWDFHRLHYDAEYAARHDLRAPIMDGQMCGALLARLVMRWAGQGARLRRLGYRLRSPVFAEETIRLTGRVTGIEGALVLCRMEIVKADGTEVVRDATAAVEVRS